MWEDLVRASIPQTGYFNRSWGAARSWWGPGTDRAPLEVDVVAESADGATLLVGEVEWSPNANRQQLRTELQHKITRLPFAHGRDVLAGIWTPVGTGHGGHFGPRDILRALR